MIFCPLYGQSKYTKIGSNVIYLFSEIKETIDWERKRLAISVRVQDVHYDWF
jgi:hypothetical protein